MKKISLLLVLVMVLSACSPKKSIQNEHLPLLSSSLEAEELSSSQTQSAITRLRIAYDASDTLNPYLVQSTTNKNIIPLLYDPLVKLDRTYKAVPYAAKTAEHTGLVWTITLRDDVYFTDGTKMTARDVVYSMDLARSEGSQFAGELVNVDSYAVVDNYTIAITLKTTDLYFENLLTFPIVKYRELEQGQTIQQHLSETHIGTGRYILTAGNTAQSLRINEQHFEGASSIKDIDLITLPDDNSLSYSLKVGVIDYMFSELNSPDLYNISSSNILINMNNLVYMGMNSNKSFFSNPSVRRAIELLIDRNEIVSKTYSNKATAAYTPFNPSFWALEKSDAELKNKRNVAIASEILDVSGYSVRDEQQYRMNGASRLTLRLLINSESEYKQQMALQIQEYFKVAGIDVKIEAYSFAEYKQKLAMGDFDLYIAEVKLYDNMDISELINPQNLLGSGAPYHENLQKAYTDFKEGTITADAFLAVFDEVKPFIPILYRRGMVAFSRDFSADIVATEQDIFYNIVNW